MSSLSLRLLESCKVCIFKATPLACVKRRKKLYIRQLFLFYSFCVIFFFVIFYFRITMKQVLMFYFWVIIYFNLDVLCKNSFMKKSEYIHAQISSLLHVYKCVCTCIFVCRNMCINWRKILTKDQSIYKKQGKTCLLCSCRSLPLSLTQSVARQYPQSLYFSAVKGYFSVWAKCVTTFILRSSTVYHRWHL